jgi:hypothetical protein
MASADGGFEIADGFPLASAILTEKNNLLNNSSLPGWICMLFLQERMEFRKFKTRKSLLTA